MHGYLLTISYDGAAFSGWQRQEGFATVQQRLEDAVLALVGEPVVVHGAGRTDAGVHAIRQAAHFWIPRAFEPGKLLMALNGNLPGTVRVIGVRPAPPGFHARFSAIGKRYVYRCLIARIAPIFERGRCHWIRRACDVERMRRAARHLRGEHDFAAFATNPGYERKRGTVRRIDHLHIHRRARGFDIAVQGNGFLYNMVRTIAGTLIEVGVGKREPDEVALILASCDRRLAGENVPAEGLYLLRVLYPPHAFRFADGVATQSTPPPDPEGETGSR